MLIGRFILYICFYYFVFNNVLCVHGLSASAVVGHSWRRSDLSPINFFAERWNYISGYNFSAQILLSTAMGCSFSSKQKNSFAFPTFGFGFIWNYDSKMGVSVGVFLGTNYTSDTPVLVWSANENHPVDEDASLELTADGNLILKDRRGRQAWSTNTTGHSVKSMNLTCEGNLILMDYSGSVVWQSFDHATDTWLPRQTLNEGQILASGASGAAFSPGLFYVLVARDGLHAFINTDPPVEYSFTYYLWYDTGNPFIKFSQLNLFKWPNFTYLQLQPNGHLIQFTYNGTEGLPNDVLHIDGGDCGYPTRCGNYGICSDNRCACPQDTAGTSSYFRPVDPFTPDSGCTRVTRLACSDTYKNQTFLELENVTYFGFDTFLALKGVDADTCKTACLRNCSCVAAIFHYYENSSSGNCSLPSKILTLRQFEPEPWDYQSTVYLKVQGSDTLTNNSLSSPKNSSSHQKKISSLVPELVPAISAFFLVFIFCAGVCYYVTVKRRKADKCLSDVVTDSVSRFSFESLRLATQDFQNRLGRGGFGSVFKGALGNGKKIAVKCLDSVGQGRKEFLAEVNIIGTLNHFNLVKLIGFCEEGLHRLLVYEYMHNGSLDKWIFNQDRAQTLTWSLRQKIICGIAKGLEYLHENCNQKVIHFDIKPQNILLDADFNVKISDFGLAKMVDRDQAQVMTIIRGTPGYIAPELITGRAISVKVDVYSFGVLALEIVCGRKNVGLPEEECLTNLLKVKADEDRLADLVDMRTEDLQFHTEEAVKMMKIGIWCLQPHFIRPTMSMVVKVLQDLPNMKTLTDLSYLTVTHEAIPTDVNLSFSTRPTESLLSGPR